ncbi:MAG: hypothetical protein LKF79_01020 [Solobacterium sp.]|jgi:hypothetical protein|nr:hypothetical protein [Solobacterium sp.]MCH4265209.1 hypothetical protein [Solobacterium sp.]
MNGYLMSGDDVIAHISNDLVVGADSRVPFFFSELNCVSDWLKSRSSDHNRTNIRLIRKVQTPAV